MSPPLFALVLTLVPLASCVPSSDPAAAPEVGVEPLTTSKGSATLAPTAAAYGPAGRVAFRLYNGFSRPLEYGPCGELQRLGADGWERVEPAEGLACDDVLFTLDPGASGWLGARVPGDYAVPLEAYRLRPGAHRLVLSAAIVGGRSPLTPDERRPVVIRSAPFEVGP